MPGAVFVRVLQMSLTGCYSIGIVLAVMRLSRVKPLMVQMLSYRI